MITQKDSKNNPKIIVSLPLVDIWGFMVFIKLPLLISPKLMSRLKKELEKIINMGPIR
jgi:hypothetical protein